MKQRTYLKKGLALCLCALCLLSFMVPAFAAKKETTSFRHASVKMKLAYTRTVYSGKEKTPAVTVKHDGKVLKEGKHYTVRYKDNVDVGDATVVIKAKDGSGYTGKRVYTFSIVPKKVNQPTLVKATEDTIKFRWEPVTGATGYVVYFYDAIRNTYHKIKATKKTAATVGGLQPDTTYLFVVRAYTNTGTATVRLYGKYSAWLNAKTKPAPAVTQTKTAPYAAILQSGTYTLKFMTDTGVSAGAATTVCHQGDNLAVETKISGTRMNLLKNDEGLFAMLPLRKRYVSTTEAVLAEALDATGFDDLFEALTLTPDDAPQLIEVRRGKKILQRELFHQEDGAATAFDFDGDTLIEIVFFAENGGVSVTSISAFSSDAAADAFTLPADYQKVETIL